MAIHPVTRTNVGKYEYWFKPDDTRFRSMVLRARKWFLLKIFAYRGRDFQIYRYKFMNALNRYRTL